MKKPTCTFPKGFYVILGPEDVIKRGDKFNWRHPVRPAVDYWLKVYSSNVGIPASAHPIFVFIRPLTVTQAAKRLRKPVHPAFKQPKKPHHD